MSATHTVAALELSPAAFDEIADKLRRGRPWLSTADQFDMTGIVIVRGPETADVVGTMPWFWRVEDDADCGDTLTQAMECTDFFVVEEIGSSVVVEHRAAFYFKVPRPDLGEHEEEIIGPFNTKDEAEVAMAARRSPMPNQTQQEDV